MIWRTVREINWLGGVEDTHDLEEDDIQCEVCRSRKIWLVLVNLIIIVVK